MSLFGQSRGFGILLVAGAGVTAWLVSRDYTTEEQLVATLRKKNNMQGYGANVSEQQKFEKLLRQVNQTTKDPSSENKNFDDLLKRGAGDRTKTTMTKIESPPDNDNDNINGYKNDTKNDNNGATAKGN